MPRRTATSAPIPFAQKPSILRSSTAFAAVTPKFTPAAIAGKYEFEIMSGTASFMAMSYLGLGVCAGGNTRAVREIASVLCCRRHLGAAWSRRAQAQGKARGEERGEPHHRQDAAES